jgi:hypothetical protein
MGFEPAVPAAERAKRVHTLDRSSTATDNVNFRVYKIMCSHVGVEFGVSHYERTYAERA